MFKQPILLVLCFLLVAGCGGNDGKEAGKGSSAQHSSAENPDGSRRGGRLIVGVQQEPEMLNEMLNSMASNNLICNLIFSKFVKYDDSLNLIPDLIEEIPTVANGGISDDYMTYTYHLRPNVRWHDGTPLTSADVKFTYDVIMNPQVNVESREGWDVIASVETPDERTVVFHLKKHYPDFVAETFYDEPVLPKHLLEDKVGRKFQTASFHHAPVGSGPFEFKEWVSGSHLTLVANPDYYMEGPYLDEIIFKFIPDMNALLVQLKTGEIDFFYNADINFLDQLQAIPGIKVYKTPMLMYEHLDLNMESPLLKDKKIRKALSYATNKKEIAEKVYRGVVQVAPLDEFPSSRYYNEAAAAKVRYSPFDARRLLHEAGWSDTDGDGILEKGGKKLSLTISSTAGQVNRERTEVLLMSQYREVGVELKIRNYNSTVLFGTYADGGILKRGKFDIAMYAWLSSPEPATKEALYSSRNIPPYGQNNPRIRHDALTRLLAMGSEEVDADERVSIYKQVSDILVEEVPVIPLFWYTAIDACRKDLVNFRPNPTQSSDTWNANQWYFENDPP